MTDKEMIEHESQWPKWPFLPVIRGDEKGVLWTGTRHLTVHMGNLFRLPETREEFEALPKFTYESTEALLADGWRVD